MKKIARLIIIITILASPFLVIAQPPGGTPPGGGATGGNPQCWPPPCIPIDGGISFLILAGLGLGAKKAYDISNNSKKVG